jgi:Kazal-type serine protease inhibitor domain
MKTRFIVSLATTLALLTFIPNGAGAVGVGKTCGGFVGLPCGAGEFCQHKAGQCGWFDQTGMCAKIPQFCSHIYLPVCGCDGRTFSNDCEREKAMVSLAHKGKCQ